MEEHDIFLSYLRVTQHMSQQFRTHFGRLNLTFPQALVLTVLGEDGPVPISTLAERTGSANSTVSGIVDRLEEKGLVYRTVSATDGRCRILALTEEGQRFHDDFQTVLHQVNERLERGFTQEEKAQFTAFLLRAGRNLTDEEEEA